MKKTTTIILLIGSFIIGLSLYWFVQQNTSVDAQISQQENSQKWETKIDAQANVTIVVTPLDISPRANEWRFDIGMNTHSVELSQDLKKIASLIDDSGNVYQPILWDGPQEGGHHIQGTLVFRAPTSVSKTVKLQIKNVGDVPVRMFTWEIDGGV